MAGFLVGRIGGGETHSELLIGQKLVANIISFQKKFGKMSRCVFRWAVFFAVCFVILNANESISFEEQYCKRSQQYPIGNYQRIIVASPYRTGSTIVFNVLKFLFNNSDSLHSNSIVGKCHFPKNPDPAEIVFCPIRNPMDTCFSRYRVMGERQNQTINERALDIAVNEYLRQMHGMHKLLQKKLPNVVLLKYEDFDCNLWAIFDKVETLFNMKICEIDKALIEELFSKKNVKYFVEKYEGFGQWDPLTGFHGKHIDEGNEFSEEEKHLIYEKIRERLLGKCGFLEEYGYVL